MKKKKGLGEIKKTRCKDMNHAGEKNKSSWRFGTTETVREGDGVLFFFLTHDYSPTGGRGGLQKNFSDLCMFM